MNNIKQLRALSICQPWAECIVSRGKNVENRNWNTKYRGFFAIHASRSNDPERFEDLKEYRIRLDPTDLPFGAIVGFAELVDVVTEDDLTRATQRWFQGDYGFVLKNVIRLKKPIPAKGALSFWKLSGHQLREALAQLNAKQLKSVASRKMSKPS